MLFFSSVEKAHDILTNPEKLHQFNLMDPDFEEDMPAASEIKVSPIYLFIFTFLAVIRLIRGLLDMIIHDPTVLTFGLLVSN